MHVIYMSLIPLSHQTLVENSSMLDAVREIFIFDLFNVADVLLWTL